MGWGYPPPPPPTLPAPVPIRFVAFCFFTLGVGGGGGLQPMWRHGIAYAIVTMLMCIVANPQLFSKSFVCFRWRSNWPSRKRKWRQRPKNSGFRTLQSSETGWKCCGWSRGTHIFRGLGYPHPYRADLILKDRLQVIWPGQRYTLWIVVYTHPIQGFWDPPHTYRILKSHLGSGHPYPNIPVIYHCTSFLFVCATLDCQKPL